MEEETEPQVPDHVRREHMLRVARAHRKNGNISQKVYEDIVAASSGETIDDIGEDYELETKVEDPLEMEEDVKHVIADEHGERFVVDMTKDAVYFNHNFSEGMLSIDHEDMDEIEKLREDVR